MEYVYATLLLHSSGKNITETGISKVLTAAGTKPDPARVKALVSSLEGVNIEEAISSAVISAAAPAAAPAAQEKPEEAKAEAPAEEEEEEEEDTMAGLGSLFG